MNTFRSIQNTSDRSEGDETTDDMDDTSDLPEDSLEQTPTTVSLSQGFPNYFSTSQSPSKITYN